MYLIPMGILLSAEPTIIQAATTAAGGVAPDLANLTWVGFAMKNLLPVTIGNIIGGAILVGGVYWLAYRRATARFPWRSVSKPTT